MACESIKYFILRSILFLKHLKATVVIWWYISETVLN